LIDVTVVLDRLEIPWVRAGALAALDYRAEPRLTADADVLVRWDARLVGALEADGWEVRAMSDPEMAPHLLMLKRGDDRVDLLVAVTEYQELALERGFPNRVLTVEDVIVHKLIAWRARDQRDIASILSADHVLDEKYIVHWATEWSVLDRWHAARELM
jgi:hypothetical protein